MARPRPSAEAMALSTRPSMASCWTIRQRLAPRAPRRAISRCLAVERASMRLVPLTQEISHNTPDAPKSASSAFLRSLPNQGIFVPLEFDRGDPLAVIGIGIFFGDIGL